jgi:hypothetical protein
VQQPPLAANADAKAQQFADLALTAWAGTSASPCAAPAPVAAAVNHVHGPPPTDDLPTLLQRLTI